MAIDMETYKKIRRLHLVEGIPIRQISRDLGVSRNTVKKYIHGDVIPGESKFSPRQKLVMNEEVIKFMKACILEDNEHTHTKQRHTAKRIWTRLQEELGFTGSYSSVKVVLRELKNKNNEVFLPLTFNPAEAMQIDFGSAHVYIHEEKQEIKYFCARLAYSAHIFAKVYLAEREECFLDGVVSAFEYFGGVPREVLFDNARVAVSEGYGRHVTKITKGYETLVAHYAFKPKFCNVRSGNEKGIVENLVGLIRRNTMVPIPRIKSLQELNLKIKKSCDNYLETHKVNGESLSVKEKFQLEARNLLALPNHPLDISKRDYKRVTKFSTITFETNKYSLPCELVGKEVILKAGHSEIQFLYQGKVIATHQRIFKKNKSSYQLAHYLKALERKPRSVFNADPVIENIPRAVLEEYQSKGDSKAFLEYLRVEVGLPQRDTQLEIQRNDLGKYDNLISREVIQ